MALMMTFLPQWWSSKTVCNSAAAKRITFSVVTSFTCHIRSNVLFLMMNCYRLHWGYLYLSYKKCSLKIIAWQTHWNNGQRLVIFSYSIFFLFFSFFWRKLVKAIKWMKDPWDICMENWPLMHLAKGHFSLCWSELKMLVTKLNDGWIAAGKYPHTTEKGYSWPLIFAIFWLSDL